ncbi:uncharacterized protein LOC134254820 [Saccostrea cucullata]|uniref:uncharacterized protein LOC134254820 n=1 Tax=Saccostrea cuccullata TaxID=36930 RepID=UPI002ED2783B
MADSVHVSRAEARKKKILENAEKRINRLYSRQPGDQDKDKKHEEDLDSKSAESGEWQCDKCGNINFGSRKACLLCRGKQMTDEKDTSDRHHQIDQSMKNTRDIVEKSETGNSQERPLSISRPNQSEVRQRKSPNTVKLQRGDTQHEASEMPLPQSTRVQPSWKYSQPQLFEMYRILGCILIAFVSRMVLKSGYGLFYFETIFLPFTAFQTGLHLFKNNFLKDVHIYQKQNIMSTALMLCGISPHLIHTYSRIMGYVKALTEDLFFFLFVFFACGFFI